MSFGPFQSQLVALVVAGHLLAVLLNVSLAVYVARAHRERPLGRVFALLLGALAVWTLGSLAKLFTLDPDVYVGLSMVQYVGITSATALLFVFALLYDSRDRWVTRQVVAGLLVVPALVLVGLASTNVHGLFYADYVATTLGGRPVLTSVAGPWFWGWTAYGWTLLAVASGLILYSGFRRSAFYRLQSLLVIAGVGISWLVNLLFVGFGWPHQNVDPTPLGLTVTGLFFTVGIFTTSLVDILPAARSEVLDAIDDAVIALDPHGRVVDVNEPGRALFAGSVPFGQPAADVLPAELYRPDAGDRKTVELDDEGQSAVYQYRRLPVGPEGVHGEVIVLTELSDLIQARRELERQNERLDEFASVVSHDLRNPLSIARGNLELARDDGDEGRLDEVEAAHARMEALIDDLLTLARQGRMVGETDTVDLATAAREAWNSVATDEATLELGEDIGTVQADRDRLQQLLANLFSNAIEHAGPAVAVRVEATEAGFAVEDDGPGIDADNRGRVFDHGFTTSADGTGFGLAIVRSVAEAHGWGLDLAEGRDGGLRVEFTGVERA